MRILGVHGIGNLLEGVGPAEAAEQLAGVWRHHLARGAFADAAAGCELSVAYYADLLADEGAQSAGPVGLDDLDAEAEELLSGWLDQLGLPAEPPQGLLTWPFRQAVEWIAERDLLKPETVEMFVARYAHEVAAYLSAADDARRRTEVRAVMLAALREWAPRVVIAHSLGSVVAYEALWAYEGEPVDLLITLGSPLAVPRVVFPRLEPAPSLEGLGRRPPSVRRWVNIADTGDLVAVPRGGVGKRFLEVAEDHHDRIHAFDFHKVANYLAAGAVNRVLRAELARGGGRP
ncbi:serine peptidase [Streptomyces sp. NPDC003691]